MATNGNSSTTQTQLEKVAEAAVAAGAPDTVQDLVSRDEATNTLMDLIAGELGDVGEQDAREIRAFSEHRRAELKQFLTKFLARKERELPDLRRILGRIAG